MSTKHHNSVTDIANAYLKGVYQGDTATLATLFDPNAQVFGEINGQAYHKTIVAYLDGVASRQSPQQLDEPYRMQILSIDTLGHHLAMVKLHSPMLGMNYHLYLTLRQLDGSWLIVNKTFSHLKLD